MVCKENVVSWFGNLSSYKRIDVMCTLLNMCLPFEVRFIGTCVEDLGKREYNVLRDTEHRANNVTDLAELSNLGITDKRTRRKVTLYMALLHSCNYSCAVVLYKILANFNFHEVSSLLSDTNVSQDDQPLEELLLLYTMAINHPAFNYEQKSTFGNIFLKLQEEEERLSVPKSGSAPFKSTQSCVPCGDQNDRIDPELASNCVIAPPPMQAFQGEMQIRGKTMIAGMPPGISIPPPGICIPSPEQMAMHGGGHPQYVHVGFPSMNHMPPWTGQVMMAHNQILYHPADVLPYSTSPLVSRQSSPSPSQSHSRSNSPTSQVYQRKNNSSNNPGPAQPVRNSSQITVPATNSPTASASVSNTQTNISSTNTLGTSTPSLPSIGAQRSLPQQQTQSLPPLLPSRSVGPMSNTAYARHNNVDSGAMMASKQQQQPPPPRLKPPVPGEILREPGNKEMPNFKGNFQNSSNSEIRRLSDEDVSKTDVTPNTLNTMKTQTTNGLNQTPEKKLDGPNSLHSTNEPVENEILLAETDNLTVKPVTMPEHAVMNYQQNHTMQNTRRYPPTLDPAPMQMFPAAPHTMYPSQNTCYGCLTAVPMSGMQNRFARCNTPQLYCLTGLQQLRIESDNNRNCSQSSSSDSTGSRSPPGTPPAIPWTSSDNPGTPATTDPQLTSTGAVAPPHHTIVSTHPVPPQQQPQQPQQQQQQQLERPRPRKSQTHMMRHKSHSSTSGMVNGGAPPPQPPTSLQPCMSFPAPPGHAPMTAYLPHHAHFPALRPTTGIYTNFTHAYARPTPAGYSTIAYQPNGEMMYQYPGHPLPGNTANVTAATGTPPPPPPAVAATAAAVAVQSTPPGAQVPPQQTQPQQSYVATTPVLAYAQPPPSPAKVSCYNCGSNAHIAAECKEQTMEDITRRAQYRLDYATVKQLGGEQSQSSDK